MRACAGLVVAAVGAVVLAAGLGGCGDDLCPGPSTGGLCRLVRIDGPAAGGELGFRFGEPRDLDGDGAADLVVGGRRTGTEDTGAAWAWTSTGVQLGSWRGEFALTASLFGQIALAVPDLDGDGAPDVVISAPNAVVDGAVRGLIDAYTLDGRRLWRAVGRPGDGFGWHIVPAGDHDGDGVGDLWAGAPSNTLTAHVYLVSGRDGSILRTITSDRSDDQFGWYVIGLDDLDGDRVADLAIGAPVARVDGARRGAVRLVSGATGATLRELVGELPGKQFGEMLAPLDDVDGDGVPDLAVGAPGGVSADAAGGSEVHVISGATGARVRLLVGIEGGELYGRMLARIDDLDGDGVRDLAIGAPWWRGRDGRFELRSARTNALLAEVHGTEAGWLGWHITRADGGVWASQLHLDHDRGAVELYLAR